MIYQARHLRCSRSSPNCVHETRFVRSKSAEERDDYVANISRENVRFKVQACHFRDLVLKICNLIREKQGEKL